MASFTQRRKRRHTRLCSLEAGFAITEKVQIEMLLDGAGLSYDQRNMAIISAGPDAAFDKICDTLREQHGNMHEG